jgi:DNA excision repair protein ERCC-6
MVAPRAAANYSDELLAKKSLTNLTSSFAAIAKSRPTSKLLDASELPKQEPPTREFRRLQRPLKLRPEPEQEGQVKVRKKFVRKTKRPQPEKKWRRTHDSSSDEDNQEDPDGDGKSKMFCC